MNLNEYISNQQKKINEAEETEKRDRINLSIKKEKFNENCDNAFFKLTKNIVALSKSGTFESKEEIFENTEFTKSKRFEINIYIQQMPAQYYINLTAKYQEDENNQNLTFSVYSSGYNKTIDKKFTFEEFEKSDFEELLVKCLNEFEQ